MIERYLQLLFARSYRSLQRPDDDRSLDELFAELDQLKRTVSLPTWRNTVAAFAYNHPLTDILLEDPYTCRAAQAQEGMFADAALEDLVCSQSCPPGTSSLGQRVFRCTTRRIGEPIYGERRRQIARLIQWVTRDRLSVEAAVLGCGRLPAVREMAPQTWERLQPIVAVDALADNLSIIRQTYDPRQVQPLQGSVQQLLTGELQLPPQDLICASGWLEHLEPTAAGQLVTRLVGLLKSGGYLYLSNLASDSPGRGYMELFMNWQPQGRDDDHFLQDVVQPVADRLQEFEVTRDPQRTVVQLLARAA